MTSCCARIMLLYGLVTVLGVASAYRPLSVGDRYHAPACRDVTAINYACKILRLANAGKITLATVHPSGVHDNGYAYNNIKDTCAGFAASRSNYTCPECPDPGAPGGYVCLSSLLLDYIYTLAITVPHLKVNEIAGACHTCHSRHYLGEAVDLHNGAGSSTMLSKCFSMGGRGQDERNHIHCQFYN